MNFDILRDMESFTQDMFNRIIAFQEKEHPAWNPELSFKQRIKGLPLHNLVFSNADRDPAKYGPTIAHYYPLKKEMVTFALYARHVAKNPMICDAHARNGFIGSLLALEGVKVYGLRDPQEKPNQIENFYDPKRYKLEEATLATSDRPCDVLFSSWMPSGLDDTDAIVAKQPKLIIYIFSEHKAEHSGEPQTGIPGAFGEHLPENYQLIDEWSIVRPENLFHNIWPDLTENIQEVRHVRIFANEGFHHIKVNPPNITEKSYAWEQDLLIAQTALKAKEQMQKKGFPVHDF